MAPAALAQAPRLPDRPEPPKKGEAVPFTKEFAQHLKGDEVTVACTHLVKQHPGGCPAVCPCPPILEHPEGDEERIARVHKVLEHPEGDDTGKTVPCVHIRNGKPDHPGGDPVRTPCVHWKKEHPDGDVVRKPCTHRRVKHPDGEPGTKVPCPHLVPEHPGGHKELVPCRHKLDSVRKVAKPPVTFYTDDAELQEQVLADLRDVEKLGVAIRWPRPLAVFLREPVNGNPDDNRDPFWHHYNGVNHSLMITKDPPGWVDGMVRPLSAGEKADFLARRRQFVRYVISHEIGHALTSHTCTHIDSPGGPHSMYQNIDPGLAMSEGCPLGRLRSVQ